MENTNHYASERHARRLARDMEFVALYNPTLQMMINCGVDAPRREAIRFVINNGHPRYHVSFKRAYDVVCRLLRHGKMPIRPSLQAQMWQELATRVAGLCAGGGVSIAGALEFVLEHCRASRFFITERYADTILDGARKTHREAMRRRPGTVA